VSANITGLLPGTTYHYRLLATGTYDASPSKGADRTFTTPTAPGTVATTGQATDISATSAQLNGVANTSNDSASWFFQFGQTTAYGQSTPAHKLGRGLTLVEAAISQLQPRTTYHFRLVVLQSGSPPSYGHDAVFTTQKPFGHAVLLSRRLKVRHGFAAARFKCQGLRRAPCKGRVSLKARTGAGKHSRTVSCGAARLKMTAPRRRTLHIKLGARCGGLLANARHHRLKATLKATFSTHQSRIRARVTLIRR
jgi:hypothetical protein